MKDIKDYIHLYLGADCFEIIGTKQINKVLKVTPEILRYTITETGKYILILRRLSSITDEEYNHMWFGMSEIEVKCHTSTIIRKFNATPEQVAYMLKQGIDIFNLIDSGLAIDKDTLK